MSWRLFWAMRRRITSEAIWIAHKKSAAIGGLLGGVLAAAVGADAAMTETVQNIGAPLAARRYSKSYELEADQLGTVIAHRAGYNPVRGAAFFTRIPDPGDQFLGSHPPNDQRIETVLRTMGHAIRRCRVSAPCGFGVAPNIETMPTVGGDCCAKPL